VDSRSPLSPQSKPEEVVFRGEVLDCFPEADSHKGCPLPEHIGAFVFPEGLSLRTTEQPPVMFHFVLTNVTGVKVSCGAAAADAAQCSSSAAHRCQHE
jgi:uDENN domain